MDTRVIVVTGATRGLGRALAHGLAQQGHRVFGCGRSATPGPDMAALDVADDAAVAAWAGVVLAEATPDLVINNAGVIHPNAPLWELSDAQVARVLDVNVRGVVNVARRFLPAMIDARRGVLANLSSGWGRSASPEVSVYCASKWALEGLTRSLAAELPRGLAAVAVNPGVIDTDMLRSCFGAEAAGHPGPEEWARAAVPFFLGLDAGDNGAALTVPG